MWSSSIEKSYICVRAYMLTCVYMCMYVVIYIYIYICIVFSDSQNEVNVNYFIFQMSIDGEKKLYRGLKLRTLVTHLTAWYKVHLTWFSEFSDWGGIGQ